jgi:AraC-like DNA-binding protein
MNEGSADFLVKLLSYINLAGAIHALIQAIVLFLTRRGNRRAHKYMALFLLAVAIGMANGTVTLLGIYDRWPGVAIVMGSIVLTFFPLFYLYIRATTAGDARGGFLDLLHGIPFLLGVFAWSAHFLWAGDGRGASGIEGFLVRSPWSFVLIAAVLQSVAYITGIVRLLRTHAARIKAAYSTIEAINLGWLRRRLIVFIAIWAVGLAMIAAAGFKGQAFFLAGQVVAFLTALNLFATGYRAMLQPEIIFGAAEAPPGRKYERSSLTPESAERHKALLLEMMERGKPYLDPEITLPKLAQAASIPVAHLSRVINEQLGRNFYELINGYRVEEAKRRLGSPGAGGEKLIAVALDCGFNSLATFNRVFKEATGRTPSDFRKNPAQA